MARRSWAFQGEQIADAPGFRHGYLAGDREDNRILTVTVCDARPDPARAPGIRRAFGEQVCDLVAGPPVFEEYEVVVEVEPR